MELISWNKSFETGHPIVDGQHKNLFSLVNNLHSAIQDGNKKLILVEPMERLAYYVDIHFKTEEALMLASGYPNFESHKQVHDQLKDQAFKLIKLFSIGKVDLTATISKFLSDWLTEHIMEIDIKMIEWVKKQNLN
jgi:hemerythrin